MTAFFASIVEITALLGFVLVIGAVYKYFDQIMQAFDDLSRWIDQNGLTLLACVFLLFLGLSVLAGLGFI